jgi:hypothetical protein
MGNLLWLAAQRFIPGKWLVNAAAVTTAKPVDYNRRKSHTLYFYNIT